MEKIQFSIIVPIFNEGERLRKTLDTFVNVEGIENEVEILLVDDGSTDVSSDICDEYSRKYPYIKTIHKTNGGCVSARKCGVDSACGEYIVFADGDDYVENDYLTNLKIAIKNKADYYVLNNKIGKDGNSFYKEKNFLLTGYVDKCDVIQWIFSGQAGAVWDKIYVAEIMRKCLSNIHTHLIYGEDVYINSIYLEYVNSVYVYDSSSYIHIMDSATSVCNINIKIDRLDEIDLLYNHVSSVFKRMDVEQFVKQEFNEVIISNFLKSVVLIIKSGISEKEVKDKVDKYDAYKLVNKITCRRKSVKIYAFLLRYKMFKLAALICDLRDMCINNSV